MDEIYQLCPIYPERSKFQFRRKADDDEMIQPPWKKYYEVMTRDVFFCNRSVQCDTAYLRSSLSSLLEVHTGSRRVQSAICSNEAVSVFDKNMVQLNV
eukprot:scaffold19263_cov118-Skeletonema_dohrnii-CCMP3373.AAC.2